MTRTAGTRTDAARRRTAAVALVCGLSLGGCLVTDSIEPPPEPNFPPLVLSSYSPGSAILFDATKTPRGLTIPIEIRDEDTTEILKPRWRVTSGSLPPSTTLDYDCPEPSIMGTGSLIRTTSLILPSTKFLPGSCSVVEFIVSAHFLRSCLKNPEPEFFDVTTNPDNDSALGRAFFWVWEISDDPLTNNDRAQQLLSSCPKAPYQANTPSATVTVPTTQPP